MKTYQYKYFVSVVLSALLFTSCVQDNSLGTKDEEGYLQTRAGSVNEDGVAWEDRVNTVRMIVFEPVSGEMVLNRVLDFGGEITSTSKSKPIQMKVGTYHFLFIANENSYSDLTSQLDQIYNLADFDKPYFKQLNYEKIDPNKGFIPSKEKPFLMSAYYSSIVVHPSTIQSPYLFTDNEGYKGISLIRAFSKVNIKLRLSMDGEQPILTDSRVSKILLNNIAVNYVLPGSSLNYTESSSFTSLSFATGLQEGDYNNPDGKIGQFVFYVPELIRNSSSTTLPISLSFEGTYIPSSLYDIFSTNQSITDSRDTPMPSLPTDIDNKSLIRNIEYVVDAVLLPTNTIEINYVVQPWVNETIDFEYQPAIINLSTKDIQLQGNVGTLFFNFVGSNGIEATYMSFLKITDSAGTPFTNATAIKEVGKKVYKLTFTVPTNSPTLTTHEGYIYFIQKKEGYADREYKIKLSIH
ncbi:hypothetical protein [Bacteroides sp.]|uniref:hypothetical protein n=1 Tax=Bacteroides sp. TaxID=29523 RepID=UPI0025878EC8|nr:hypothetical protein [Bacteroides sp.]